jgi:hypothetical protein
MPSDRMRAATVAIVFKDHLRQVIRGEPCPKAALQERGLKAIPPET